MSDESLLPDTHDSPNDEGSAASTSNPEYVVVARRYRPQQFADLIGQQHVAKALTGAIETNRVGHAYLFTGARGVGKTSAARILGKALNCVEGPTETPCGVCDVCQGVAAGTDVDVLEIDGASNRGIDEIRQLRSNVNIRPSRARFKIYIIDEVHMLTREAFNALLKTLEEPPPHVKFIFCTTEPNKIPVTVLSRCQRFDFAGVETAAIVERLRQIVEAEGLSAEPEALEVLARRANGSMRDSQSLLEQLLSFIETTITADDVHRLLGTAANRVMADLATCVAQSNAAAALAHFGAAIDGGGDEGRLMEQLMGYFRDVMAASVGCGDEAMQSAIESAQCQQIREIAEQMKLSSILARIQVFDHALQRMRFSVHRRTIAEVALVRACELAELDTVESLIAELRGGEGAPARPQKKTSPPPSLRDSLPDRRQRDDPPHAAPPADRHVAAAPSPPPPPQATPSPTPSVPETPPPAPTQPVVAAPPAAPVAEIVNEPANAIVDDLSAKAVWDEALDLLTGMVADNARSYSHLANSGPNQLVVSFADDYNFSKTSCESPEQLQKIRDALRQVAGVDVRVDFKLLPAEAKPEKKAEPDNAAYSEQRRLWELNEHELIKRAGELFGAKPVKLQ